MKILHIILLFIFASSCMAHAPKATALTDELDCTNINTSPQLDDCVYKGMMNSKNLLSNEYLSFEKRAKNVYAADSKLGKELIKIVREAQDAWIAFRDKTCKIEAFEIEKKAPAYATTINNCVIRMNIERIKELKNLMQ